MLGASLSCQVQLVRAAQYHYWHLRTVAQSIALQVSKFKTVVAGALGCSTDVHDMAYEVAACSADVLDTEGRTTGNMPQRNGRWDMCPLLRNLASSLLPKIVQVHSRPWCSLQLLGHAPLVYTSSLTA